MKKNQEQESPQKLTDVKFETISLDRISSSKTNPRKNFDEKEMDDLIESIKREGILVPLVVRPEADGYEVVDGERRLRAADILQMDEVPCFIINISAEETQVKQIVFNLQRADLHPMEEAEAFALLWGASDFASQKSIADRIGKPESYVAERVELLQLVPDAKKLYKENVLTLDHATLLCKLTEGDQMRALRFLIRHEDEGGIRFSEGVEVETAKDVRLLKAWIDEEVNLNLHHALWDLTDAELIPGVVPCSQCAKNSAFNQALFPEAAKNAVCYDRRCFKAKLEAYKVRVHKLSRKEDKRAFILISTEHHIDADDPLKVKDVKMSGRFKAVKAGNECENTKKAQWIDGPNKGKFTLVCNYSKCPKHWKENASGSSARAGSFDSAKEKEKREKAQAEAERTRALLVAQHQEIVKVLLTKIPKKVTCAVLRTVMLGGGYSGWVGNDGIVTKVMGLKGNLDKIIGGLPEPDLVKLAILNEMDEMFDAALVNEHDAEDLDRIASRFGVDVKAIRKATTKRLEEATKVKDVPGLAKAKAGKRGKK